MLQLKDQVLQLRVDASRCEDPADNMDCVFRKRVLAIGYCSDRHGHTRMSWTTICSPFHNHRLSGPVNRKILLEISLLLRNSSKVMLPYVLLAIEPCEVVEDVTIQVVEKIRLSRCVFLPCS